METVFFLFTDFPSQWKASWKLVEVNFKRKSIFKLMKTDFLASGNHFLPFSQTAVNCASGNNLFFKRNTFFSQSFIQASWNEFFVYWKQYCFIPSFFYKWKLLLKLSEILRFFKVETTFPYSGNAFFNKSFIRLVKTDFLSNGKCFLMIAVFLSVEAIIGISGIIASGQLIFWLVETIFFSVFQRLLLVIVFFAV